MKIHELKIEGFKSIGEIKLVEPNPFSVFVGPNGAGKSNIFEGLEFMQLCRFLPPTIASRLFGDSEDLFNQLNHQNLSPGLLILKVILPVIKLSFSGQ